MMVAPAREPVPRKPLRLWPGVAAVVLQWVIRFLVPVFSPEAIPFALIGGVLGGAAVLVWWLFFSRAPWSDRIGAVVVMAAATFATTRFLDVSIATGAMGMLFPMLVIPFLSLALVGSAVATRPLSEGPRRLLTAAAIVIACGAWTLVRTGGFTGSFRNDLQWRWSKTPEQRLLARTVAEPPARSPVQPDVPPKQLAPKARSGSPPPSEPRAEPVIKWSGFRGPGRDGIVWGVRIETDWTASPPVKLWQRAVGPGWSSFAVRGDLIYTQEQRGPDELVSCYKLSTGQPVWTHRDTARFWESNAGPGPRATPTLGNGRIYSFGATGILNALNADTGAVIWSRNAAADTGAKTPEWGFASSPLIFDDLLIVAISGQLAAYDLAKGTPRWLGPKGGASYSSPQLLKADGIPQVVLLGQSGIASVGPADGAVLWEHTWKGYPIVQPAITPDGDVLISVSDSSGIRRLSVTHGASDWHAEERWTSMGLKPYFNDFVVHNGYVFGFDAGILACIDLKDGRRKWKGGRYGHGQLMLLADQDLLLVLSEEGELALVKAIPDGFTELARLPAIEGKTWNHPVLAGDVLLVRNGEQMAAFRLSEPAH